MSIHQSNFAAAESATAYVHDVADDDTETTNVPS